MVEATIHLKGVTLRAQDRARDMRQAVNLCEEELSRQVKRHREKRRGRRKVGTETIRDEPSGGLRRGRLAGFLDAQKRRGPAATLALWAFLTVR